jgi:hypothetical protein
LEFELPTREAFSISSKLPPSMGIEEKETSVGGKGQGTPRRHNETGLQRKRLDDSIIEHPTGPRASLRLSANPEVAIRDVANAFKGRTSHDLRKEFPDLLKLPSLWTHSYFASTAGNVSSATIEKYIAEQSTI